MADAQIDASVQPIPDGDGSESGLGAPKTPEDSVRSLAHHLDWASAAIGHARRHLEAAQDSPESAEFNLAHVSHHLDEASDQITKLAGCVEEEVPGVTDELATLQAAKPPLDEGDQACQAEDTVAAAGPIGRRRRRHMAKRRTITAADAPPVGTAPQPSPDQPSAPPSEAGPTQTAMICFLLDDDTAKALQAAYPPPDGASVPSPPHITIRFLGDVSGLDRSAVEEAITDVMQAWDEEEDEEAGGEGSPDDTDSITGTFNGLARFAAESDEDGNEGGALTPIVALFDAPELEELHEAFDDALEDVDGVPDCDHGFTAHSTIARVALGDDDSVSFGPVPNLEVIFSEVALVWGDASVPENITTFPFEQPPAAEPEAGSQPAAAGEGMHVIKHSHRRGDPQKAMAVGPNSNEGEEDDNPEDAEPPDAQLVPDEDDDIDEMSGRPMAIVGPLGMFEALLVTEGSPTGDGDIRILEPGSVAWPEMPLPLMWNLESDHEGSRQFGLIIEIERQGNDIIARGAYGPPEVAAVPKALIDSGQMTWVSIDLSPQATATVAIDEYGRGTVTFTDAPLIGATVLSMPAMASTWIRSIPGSENPDGLRGMAPPENLEPEMLLACGAPECPPADWFTDPVLTAATPLTVGDDGRVFGHVALWNSCHRSFSDVCLNPPRSKTGYAHFLTGEVVTSDGGRVPTGVITAGTGHADESIRGTAGARRYYDHTGYGVADVTCGEDEFGIWVAGAVRPTATAYQVQSLRASAPSGDWRKEMTPDGPNLELGALLAVNMPGYLVPRKALVASGEIETLFAGMEEIMDNSLTAAVIGATDLPLAPRDTSWDGPGASQRVAAMCKGDSDAIDPTCFSRAFFYRADGEPDTNVGSYSLGFADVVNGKLQAVFRGISAAAGRLNQTDMPADAKAGVKGKINAWYERAAKAFNDDSIVSPFAEGASVNAAAILFDLAASGLDREFEEEIGRANAAHAAEAARLDEVLGR